MSTRAIKWLEQNDIPFSIVEYDHREKGAKFAAQAIGVPLNQTIKTLVVSIEPKGYILVLMPGDKNLSPKKLAGACKVKRTGMADSVVAEQLTGYPVGGISPFGTKRSLPVLMEKSLIKYDKVAINAGKRGMMLVMKPEDIVRAAKSTIEELAEDPSPGNDPLPRF